MRKAMYLVLVVCSSALAGDVSLDLVYRSPEK
jgi:hypothetical protein